MQSIEKMEDIKKMNDGIMTEDIEKMKTDALGEKSDADEASITSPKKRRGRPAKLENKKMPSGRGRGRPSKKHTDARSANDSEDGVDGASSGAVAVAANGSAGGRGRGRPKKLGKLKVEHAIVATGKGRGRRLKKLAKSDNDDDDEENDEDSDSLGYTPNASSNAAKKKQLAAKTKSPGRPRKEVHSDDDCNDSEDDKKEEEEERRPVGRPSTGAVNLNIVRTGRGQGRPKHPKRAAEDNVSAVPKKRGRPPGGKSSYVYTGKPRGRPTNKVAVQNNDSDHDSDGDDSSRSHSMEKQNTSKQSHVEDDNDDDGKDDSES